MDPKQIVADINTDMFLPLFPLKKLTIFGLDESDLGDDRRGRARNRWGSQPQADPEPKRNVFIRSDQYSFIRRGIPSLALKVGFDKGSPEEQIAKKWLTERYHAPSDDLNQPVDKQAAGHVRPAGREAAGASRQPRRSPAMEGHLVLQAIRRLRDTQSFVNSAWSRCTRFKLYR